jgi:hypothetical protein
MNINSDLLEFQQTLSKILRSQNIKKQDVILILNDGHKPLSQSIKELQSLIEIK